MPMEEQRRPLAFERHPLATKRQGVAFRRHAAEKFRRQRTLKHGTLRISRTAESSQGTRQKADKASLPVHASR